MSEHRVTIRWTRTSADVGYDSFNRDHEWDFGAGLTLPASSAPEYLGAAGAGPDDATLAQLHEKAHKYCFIANSVKTEITVEG